MRTFSNSQNTKKFVSWHGLGRQEILYLNPDHNFTYINLDVYTVKAVGTWDYNDKKIILNQDESKIKPAGRDVFPDTAWFRMDTKVLEVRRGGKILKAGVNSYSLVK